LCSRRLRPGWTVSPECASDDGSDAGVRNARITVDTAVIGVSGITADRGLTTADLEESLVAGEMIAAAHRTIVLADTSKLGKKSFAHICRLDQVQTLLTGTGPAHDLACALREARVEVTVATDE
jgi:DeoR/GlpR family transcriptional regulator of sugar metabolism